MIALMLALLLAQAGDNQTPYNHGYFKEPGPDYNHGYSNSYSQPQEPVPGAAPGFAPGVDKQPATQGLPGPPSPAAPSPLHSMDPWKR